MGANQAAQARDPATGPSEPQTEPPNDDGDGDDWGGQWDDNPKPSSKTKAITTTNEPVSNDEWGQWDEDDDDGGWGDPRGTTTRHSKMTSQDVSTSDEPSAGMSSDTGEPA